MASQWDVTYGNNRRMHAALEYFICHCILIIYQHAQQEYQPDTNAIPGTNKLFHRSNPCWAWSFKHVKQCSRQNDISYLKSKHCGFLGTVLWEQVSYQTTGYLGRDSHMKPWALPWMFMQCSIARCNWFLILLGLLSAAFACCLSIAIQAFVSQLRIISWMCIALGCQNENLSVMRSSGSTNCSGWMKHSRYTEGEQTQWLEIPMQIVRILGTQGNPESIWSCQVSSVSYF